MKVYKFGGASVRDADAIINVAGIIAKEKNLIVVVSAMGSTTDKLVEIFNTHQKRGDYSHLFFSLQAYHIDIIKSLFGAETISHDVYSKTGFLFREIERTLDFPPVDPEIFYDELLSYGEIISSVILSNYLIKSGVKAVWKDAREIIITDDEFGRANVLWEEAEVAAVTHRDTWLGKEAGDVAVTQGFIGATKNKQNRQTTTLGREGSDFSAAVLANCFDAESLTLWKDVPGLMNADPKILPDAEVLDEIPYAEAAEMMYHGANLIHVKTIQPIAAKNIPLYVKCFKDQSLSGTKIHNCVFREDSTVPPIIVFKEDQVRVTCKLPNLAFITELHLQQIFMILHQHFVRPSMIEHSAFSVTFTLDFEEAPFSELLKHLGQGYNVYYRVGLTLLTVKNRGEKTIETIHRFKDIGEVVSHQHSGPVAHLLIDRQIIPDSPAPNGRANSLYDSKAYPK